jgi:hypothetical protein
VHNYFGRDLGMNARVAPLSEHVHVHFPDAKSTSNSSYSSDDCIFKRSPIARSGQQLAEMQPQRQRAEIAALTTYWISTELRASSLIDGTEANRLSFGVLSRLEKPPYKERNTHHST